MGTRLSPDLERALTHQREQAERQALKQAVSVQLMELGATATFCQWLLSRCYKCELETLADADSIVLLVARLGPVAQRCVGQVVCELGQVAAERLPYVPPDEPAAKSGREAE